MCTNNFPTYSYRFWRKEDAAIAIMHTLSYMIAFTCFFTNNMYYFPTYIARFWRKGRDSHSYHAYTYMIAFTCFLTATLLSCMNCCTFNKVPRSIVDDMYLVNVTNIVQYNYYIVHNNSGLGLTNSRVTISLKLVVSI